MTYTQALVIANIKIRVESDEPFQLSDRCRPFIADFASCDVCFRLFRESSAPDWSEAAILSKSQNDEILQLPGGVIKVHYATPGHDAILFYLCHPQAGYYDLHICGRHETQFAAVNPLYYVDLSEFLIRYQTIVLHSSFIRFQGKGILFTAPSGAGKSTQAELWRRFLGAEILNGDRSLIRFQNGSYTAYGSPYAGSSGIYRSESAPVQAVVVLGQANENKIRKLALREACLHLLSQMSISSSSREVVDSQSLWLMDFLAAVPVYRLDCRPDQGAVELLHQTIGDTVHGKK